MNNSLPVTACHAHTPLLPPAQSPQSKKVQWIALTIAVVAILIFLGAPTGLYLAAVISKDVFIGILIGGIGGSLVVATKVYSLLFNTPKKEEDTSLSQPVPASQILSPQERILQAFLGKGMHITSENVNAIAEKFEYSLAAVERLLNKGLLSVKFFLECPNQLLYSVELLLEKGVSPSFFLNHEFAEIKRVIEWQLKPQEPLQDFLHCINQYDTIQEALAAWTTKVDKATIQRWTEQPKEAAKHSYQVNAPSFDTLLSGYGNQELFSIGMETTIEIAADSIQHKGWDFTTLVHFCAFRRRVIAGWQKDHRVYYPHYGFPRGGPLRWGSDERDSATTELTGVYAVLKKVLNDLEERYCGAPLPVDLMHIVRSPIEHPFPPNPMPDFFFAKSRQYGFGAFYMNINGQPIELSTSCFFSCYDVRFSHTQVKYVDVLYAESSKTCAQALQEADLKSVLKHLGKLFWLICQAKLWHNGDPSIAEMIFRTVLLSKGWQLPPWKAGIIPWIEVSKCIDGNAFAENFATLFAGELSKKRV